MKTSAIVLVTLFVAQLAVAGVLYYNTTSQRSIRPQGSLLTLDTSEVSRIVIDGHGASDEKASVTLEKKADAWLLSSTGLPVEATRVDTTLQTFRDMKLGWAVASSDSSHQQLEVADDNYQRRVRISNDADTLGDIFVGTSPGFKRSHVRKEGTDEVYSVAINTFDLPVTASDWLDKSLLQMSDVASVTIAGSALIRQDDQWIYAGDDNTDQEKATEMIEAFEALRVTDLATNASEDLDFETIVLQSGDAEYEYRFASSEDSFLVARSDIDSVFSIAKATYDKVIGVDLILPAPDPAGDSAPETPDISKDTGENNQRIQDQQVEPAEGKTE